MSASSFGTRGSPSERGVRCAPSLRALRGVAGGAGRVGAERRRCTRELSGAPGAALSPYQSISEYVILYRSYYVILLKFIVKLRWQASGSPQLSFVLWPPAGGLQGVEA